MHPQDELLREQPPRIQPAELIRGVGITGRVGRWVSDWAWGLVGYSRNPLDDGNEYIVISELRVCAASVGTCDLGSLRWLDE